MLRWKLVVCYKTDDTARRTTSYTSVSTKDIRSVMKRIRGGGLQTSDLSHDIAQTTPIEPWVILAAFDKIRRVTPSIKKVVRMKIEKSISVTNQVGG